MKKIVFIIIVILTIFFQNISYGEFNLSLESEIEEQIDHNIIITIGSKKCAELVNEIAKNGKNIRAHIKVDTGFGRYGFISKEEVLEVTKNLDENIKIEGIFSHFTIAYYKDNDYTKMQYNKFLEIIKALEDGGINIRLKHICNSPAFLNYPEMRLNAARIGSAFLGRVDCQNKLDLRKIGYLESQVTEIKILPKDFHIGYLNTFKTKRETKIAIVPLGYKDGFNVTIKNDMFRLFDKLRDLKHDLVNLTKKRGFVVKIKSKAYPVIGKIGMFHMIVDITNSSDINIGDKVEAPVSPLYIDSDVRREYV